MFNYNQNTKLLLFPSLHVPAPHKESSTESKTDDRRCKRSGVQARVELGKGARAKKQAKRRKQKAVGVFRCFSMSKNWYLNISAKVWAPLGNQAHRNKSSMNITVQWLATHPCKKKSMGDAVIEPVTHRLRADCVTQCAKCSSITPETYKFKQKLFFR